MSHPTSVAISGSSGFVGSYLSQFLSQNGLTVIKLQRRDFHKTPTQLATKLSGIDAVINLAGAPIIKRWSNEYKNILYHSRIDTTKKLVNACYIAEHKPSLFLSSSAIGYYDSISMHTENKHTKANDFLGLLTDNWEQEALRAQSLNIRTVIFRFGVVFGKNGGALKQMLLPFKLGLGGMIGTGKQAVSWIHIHDLARACLTVINDKTYRDAYNLTAPTPTTNQELSQTLGRVLNRPVLLTIPPWAIKLFYGEGADILTKGQRVIPERLSQAGFKFNFTNLKDTLTDCLN